MQRVRYISALRRCERRARASALHVWTRIHHANATGVSSYANAPFWMIGQNSSKCPLGAHSRNQWEFLGSKFPLTLKTCAGFLFTGSGNKTIFGLNFPAEMVRKMHIFWKSQGKHCEAKVETPSSWEESAAGRRLFYFQEVVSEFLESFQSVLWAQ